VVFGTIGVWQWPLPLTLAHVTFVIGHVLVILPGWAWLSMMVITGVLCLLPPTAPMMIAVLTFIGKLSYIYAKLTIMMLWWLGRASGNCYRRFRLISAPTNAP
jgi:hypothetical protein